MTCNYGDGIINDWCELDAQETARDARQRRIFFSGDEFDRRNSVHRHLYLLLTPQVSFAKHALEVLLQTTIRR